MMSGIMQSTKTNTKIEKHLLVLSLSILKYLIFYINFDHLSYLLNIFYVINHIIAKIK
jgi:hypothetical protein